jgi:hypothetical protein
LLREANEAGVEIIAYKAEFNFIKNKLSMCLVKKIDVISQ